MNANRFDFSELDRRFEQGDILFRIQVIFMLIFLLLYMNVKVAWLHLTGKL